MLLHVIGSCRAKFETGQTLPSSQGGRGWGGGTPHMKVVGMLIVLLRGVNFRFWSHLGCCGQNAIIFSCERLV